MLARGAVLVLQALRLRRLAVALVADAAVRAVLVLLAGRGSAGLAAAVDAVIARRALVVLLAGRGLAGLAAAVDAVIARRAVLVLLAGRGLGGLAPAFDAMIAGRALVIPLTGLVLQRCARPEPERREVGHQAAGGVALHPQVGVLHPLPRAVSEEDQLHPAELLGVQAVERQGQPHRLLELQAVRTEVVDAVDDPLGLRELLQRTALHRDLRLPGDRRRWHLDARPAGRGPDRHRLRRVGRDHARRVVVRDVGVAVGAGRRPPRVLDRLRQRNGARKEQQQSPEGDENV